MSDSPPSSDSPSSHHAGESNRWDPPTPAELEALIAGYTIERLLGRGAMGAVYKGTQTSLDRQVAIKIISSDLDEADVNFAERFKNEARAMAKLSHPGIVSVYDFGQTASGLFYIVMEFIEGTDVSHMIAQEGRLHTAHAMAITAHLCDALAYAHERGIIHRDIKPANIMVGYDGVVKVADFGLAKIETGGETVGLTRSGMTMGTLHYMAPEALTLGTAVDHRADIYAVGVMLYQMLTGKLPHGMFEMPSMQVAGLDPRYDAIIAKAMREDRNVRYQSAKDLRYDLDSILTQPVAKVEAEAKAAPAALPTMARPQRPAGQLPRPPAKSQVVARPETRSSPLPWVILVVVGLGLAAWYWVDRSKSAPESGAKVEPTAPAPSNAVPPVKPPILSTPIVSQTPVTTTPVTTTPVMTPAPAPAMNIASTPVPPAPAIPQTPAPAAAHTSAISNVPELATLDQQFTRLQAERVTSVFDADVAKLNTGYLGGIDREMVKERTAGRLDGVLALEEEKKLVTSKQPIPAADASGLLVAVKNLRAIYREAYAKLETVRGTNLNALIAPLVARLNALEADLTKQNRIADAKATREYREKLPSIIDTGNLTQTPRTTTATTKISIPADAVTFGTSRYAYYSGVHTWEDAMSKAEGLGGHLATVTTAAEDAWVISRFGSEVASGRQQFWIGAIQDNPNLPWRWVTGEKFDFTQWAPSEPNNAQAKDLKSTPPYMLGYIFQGGRMGWNDFSESQTNWRDIIVGYLVEWDDASAPKTLEEALLNYKWEWNHAPKPPDQLTFYKDGIASCSRFSWHWRITGPQTAIAFDAISDGKKNSGFKATLKFDANFTSLEAATDDGAFHYTGRRLGAISNSANISPPTATAPSILSSAAVSIFDGRTLDGWTVEGNTALFSVQDGAIFGNGSGANIFYTGKGGQSQVLKDFDLSFKVKTESKANSGVWIHYKMGTRGTNALALEVQIDHETPTQQRTGSIWSVKTISESTGRDGVWADMRVRVVGRTVTVLFNGNLINEWTQPDNWSPPSKIPNARLGEGYVGFQANGGRVWFKDISLRAL